MINFVRYRLITAIISALLISGFIGLAFYKYQTTGQVFRYSIDFTGGAQVLLKFDHPASLNAVKEVLSANGFAGAALREFGENEILVRVKLEEVIGELGSIAERMQSSISQAMPDNHVIILQSESVGPEVGSSLREKSARAVLFAILAMLAYIAFRFWSVGFALGAVLALVHDAILMLATLVLLNREISINIIGAILAVIGYSVNDTIIIFSRIKENLNKKTNDTIEHVVNKSINQTLRRTILTSMSTGLTVGSMWLFGGEALSDFSLTLLVGIIVGTYSSVYIASPIMMLFYRKKTA
jgi:protein-export membrane protein, SecD/SecF family/protein-export membrane protein SecF